MRGEITRESANDALNEIMFVYDSPANVMRPTYSEMLESNPKQLAADLRSIADRYGGE